MSAASIITWTVPLLFAHFVCCHQRRHEDTSNLPADPNKDKLIFVHTICRHGDRNILLPYPNDPFKSEKLWSGGFGELTNVGKKQHFELGQYLRRRYGALIGNDGYSPKKIFIQSTDMDRTLMSAQSNLAGMFPPSDDQIWNENFRWQPIPVHSIAAPDDYILATSKQCDRFDFMMSNYLNKTNYKRLFKKHRSLFNYLEIHSGKKMATLKDLLLLYDTLTVERLKGKRLPEWTLQILQPNGDLEMLARSFYQLFTPTAEMKKIISGYLLKEILDRCSQKMQSTLSPDRSLWLYFAHDVTMLNMLNSLNLYEPNIPPYASCLFFELYTSESGPYVKLFYKESIEKEAQLLEIPECGVKCSLNDLYKLYWDILPTKSFEAECKLRDGELLPVNGNPESYAVLIKNHRHGHRVQRQ